MRIGLIAPPWVPVPPIRYGGTEGVVDTLARGLSASEHQVVVFTTGDATCPVIRRWVHDVPPPVIGTTIDELHHVQAAYEELAHVDVIHDHTMVGPAWAGTRRHRPPVVITNHGSFTPQLRALYRAATEWATVTAISHSQRATAPDVPIGAVIHHGLDPTRYEVGPGDGGYTLFLGRFAPEKGAHRAIDIARRAGLPLRIAAKMREPAEQQYFRDRIEPLLGPDVEYLGEVGPTDREHLLRGAHSLLNPIAWPEPFGLVMVEALACGTPVVAYRHGAAPEIIRDGHTGFLVDNRQQAADALRKIETIDREACRAAITGHFSADRMVGEYVDVYEEAVARQANPLARIRTHRPVQPVGLARHPSRLRIANS